MRIHRKIAFKWLLGLLMIVSMQWTTDVAANEIGNLYFPVDAQIHPLNIASSDMIHHFFVEPAKQKIISYFHGRANIWLPLTTAYFPISQQDRAAVSDLIWHHRQGLVNLDEVPSTAQFFHADAIYSTHQINFKLPIQQSSMLTVDLRAFHLLKGKQPWSFFTSDRAIEWFHSNIAGGEDPFARKQYILDQAEVYFVNENRDSISLNSNNLYISNLSVAYTWFPKIFDRAYTNFEFQGAYNFIHWNQGIDLGFAARYIKPFGDPTKNHFRLNFALESNFENLITLGNFKPWKKNNWSWKGVFMFNYILPLKRNNILVISTGYDIQRAFVSRRNFDSAILSGERLVSHWHYSHSHMARPGTAHSFNMVYQKDKLAISFYFKEDLWVHNAPDFQTGFGIVLEF